MSGRTDRADAGLGVYHSGERLQVGDVVYSRERFGDSAEVVKIVDGLLYLKRRVIVHLSAGKAQYYRLKQRKAGQ